MQNPRSFIIAYWQICTVRNVKEILPTETIMRANISEKESVRMSERSRQWQPHSSTLAWKIPWTDEPGRVQSMGS